MSKALQVFVARRPAVLEPAASAAPPTYLTPLYRICALLLGSAPDSSRAVFLTKYGLRLEQTGQADIASRYSAGLEQATVAVDADDEAGPRHYRIFPDWQTPFFWKDARFFKNGKEDSSIEDEEIEALYPQFAPVFFDWRQFYEAAFEEQELHLESKNEVFPELGDRVAWGVEGFLMAAWLVLQPDVETVEYSPGGKSYLLRKENVDAELNSFLDVTDWIAEDVNSQREGGK